MNIALTNINLILISNHASSYYAYNKYIYINSKHGDLSVGYEVFS